MREEIERVRALQVPFERDVIQAVTEYLKSCKGLSDGAVFTGLAAVFNRQLLAHMRRSGWSDESGVEMIVRAAELIPRLIGDEMREREQAGVQ